jgi:hypothetical protein
VQPSQKLAEIRWDAGAPLAIIAPPGCNGTVEKTNRRIDFEKLDINSERLLSLSLP